MPTDDTYHMETDYAYGVNLRPDMLNLAPTGNGFYMHVTHTLFYMDADAMEPVPVCNKPNCLHYAEPELDRFRACNAYFSLLYQPYTTFFDGHLYCISMVPIIGDQYNREQPALVRTDPDGTNRKTLCRFERNAMIEAAIAHRGIMYVSTRAWLENGTTAAEIWAYSLTETNREPELILTLPEYNQYSGAQYLTAYGNCLYFSRYLSEDGKRELCIYNIQTGEMTTLPTLEDGFSPQSVSFLGDKMLIVYRLYYQLDGVEGEAGFPERLYLCNLDGSNPELLIEGLGDYSADDRYIYRVPFVYTPGNEDTCLRIFDETGSEVDQVDLSELMDGKPLGEAGLYIPMGDRAMVWLRVKKQSRVYVYWFSKSEIGSGQIEMHPLIDYDKEYSEFDRQ